MQELTNGVKSPVNGDIVAEIYYLDSDNNIQSQSLASGTNTSSIIIDLTNQTILQCNIQYIKKLDDISLVGIQIIKGNGNLLFRTIFPITEDKLNYSIKNGKYTPYKKK